MEMIAIREFLKQFKRFVFRNNAILPGMDYWNKRVAQYGKRSVFNIAHTEDELEKITERQKKEIFPYFVSSLEGTEKTVLDFGCGFGRFTPDLARMICGDAVGVDPIPALIEMARPRTNVAYRVMEGGVIPLPDEHFDIVWICLVLGGLTGGALKIEIAEIDRVLKKGGLLFIIENTSKKKNVPHWTYRQFDEYRTLLPFVALRHLHDYFDLEEQISIMAGRKR